MKRGEIWLINLDPTLGAEIRKTCRAIIVNDDQFGILPLRVIVPLTDWKDKYKVAVWMVKVNPDNKNNLDKASVADCFQIRSISEERFIRKIGNINIEVMEQIETALTYVLKLKL